MVPVPRSASHARGRPDLALVVRGLGANGTTRVMLTLAGAFADAGRRVDLLVLDGRQRAPSAIPPNVKRVEIGRRTRWHATPALLAAEAKWHAAWPSLAFPRDAGALAGLVDYLRDRRPRALLAGATHANVLSVIARRQAGSDARLVLAQHNHLSTKTARLRLRWKRALCRAYYPEADALVAVSQGVADDLVRGLGLDAGGVHSIYNPIVTPELERAARAPVDHPWLVDKDVPVVLGVGKLRKRKRFDLLLRAFARARRTRPLRLLVLGDGFQRRALIRLAARLGVAEDTAFPGVVANPHPFMREADCLALASEWEGFANVLVEALASGCPVVSTRCPSGPDEILAGGRYGTLVPTGDEEALAAALLRTLDAPRDAARLCARAREFDVSHAAAAYESLLFGAVAPSD